MEMHNIHPSLYAENQCINWTSGSKSRMIRPVQRMRNTLIKSSESKISKIGVLTHILPHGAGSQSNLSILLMAISSN